MVFVFVTTNQRRIGNICLWLSLFVGTGLFMSLYSMEWYARINCPPLKVSDTEANCKELFLLFFFFRTSCGIFWYPDLGIA